jgi:hypothetical protein
MSKIGIVYPAIIDKIITLFPTKARLHNPYELLENPEMCRKDAWGLKVESASREELEFCDISINRTFTIVFVRQFITLANKEDGFDAVTVSLIEDQQTFLEAFFSTDKIGQGDNIERIDIEAISGVNELVGDEKKYLFSEVTFNILINEAIS